MNALGFESKKDIKHELRLHETKSEDILDWEEFLDFFFIRNYT